MGADESRREQKEGGRGRGLHLEAERDPCLRDQPRNTLLHARRQPPEGLERGPDQKEAGGDHAEEHADVFADGVTALLAVCHLRSVR